MPKYQIRRATQSLRNGSVRGGFFRGEEGELLDLGGLVHLQRKRNPGKGRYHQKTSDADVGMGGEIPSLLGQEFRWDEFLKEESDLF